MRTCSIRKRATAQDGDDHLRQEARPDDLFAEVGIIHSHITHGTAQPYKQQGRGGASEAPRDVAARLLQDLEGVACPLPETAELHDECVRICMLMMRSR